MLDIAQGFIAYQDEEHGLGHKAAQSLAYNSADRLQPTRRTDANAVLAAVTGNQAQKALIPLERDGSGYDITALEGLIDYNKSLHVTGDLLEEDQYCLAVPSALIHEIAQSAHPGSFGESGAIDLAKLNRRADAASFKFSLKKRLETVYVTPDALTRCAPAIEALRADGVEIVRIEDGADPYRAILKTARDMLDPDRIIKTRMKDNEHIRTSEIRGSNHAKPLIGVLLPLEIAYGGTRNIKEIRSDGKKVLQNPDQYFDGDYFPLVDNLGAGRNLESRFVVVERRPQGAPVKKKQFSSRVKDSLLDFFRPPAPHALVKKTYSLFHPASDSGYEPFPFVRMLLKLDTRGPHVGNIDHITRILQKAGIPFTPVYLYKDKENLPVVLEIEIDKDADFGCVEDSWWLSVSHGRSLQRGSCRNGYQCALEKLLALATRKSRNHNFMILGVYGARTSLLAPQSPSVTPAWVGMAYLLASLFCALFLGLLAMRLLVG